MSLKINFTIFWPLFNTAKGALKEKNEAVDQAANERRERAKLEKEARKAQEEAEKEARIKDENIKLLRNQ